MKTIRRILALSILLIAGWIAYSLFSHRQTTQRHRDYEHRIKVLSYNTNGLGRNTQQLLTYINSQDADIVCLQEVNVYKNPEHLTLPALRHAMHTYPYTYYDFKVYNNVRQFGNVVFSRYPLIHKHTIAYSSRSNISSCCDVVIASDTIRLLVNHLESYSIIDSDLKIDTLSFSSLRNSPLSHKIKHARPLRRQQARAVKQECNNSPHPVIVVGDFNATPVSYVYWEIKHGLRDCFTECCRGKLGNTYTGHHIGVRIDYILCSTTLTPIDFSIDHVNYSDHYPVTATIGW